MGLGMPLTGSNLLLEVLMTMSWSLMVMTTSLYHPSEGKVVLVPAQRSAQQEEPPKTPVPCHEYPEMWRNSSLCQAVPATPFNPFLDFTVSGPLVLLELTKLGWAFIYDFLFHMTAYHTKSGLFVVVVFFLLALTITPALVSSQVQPS